MCVLFLIHISMGTLIRIRKVYFSYRKNGVVSVFQDIEWEKVELFGFSGSYSKEMEIRGYSGKMLKSFNIVPCVDSRKRVHFRNFYHHSVIEDCSKIRNKA